jgi:CRISPR-associated protein Csy3
VQPLELIEKSIRGTISNRQKPAIQNDPMKLNAEIEKANLQKIDVCTLGNHQDTLKIVFTLKILSGVQYPSVCNNEDFYKSYRAVAEKYIDKYGFNEIARRYALNIASKSCVRLFLDCR